MQRSRYGLTRCPKCGSHVEEIVDGGCAFCPAPSLFKRSRAGLVAASLLALSACGGDDPDQTVEPDPGSDTTGGEDPGSPDDPVGSDDPSEPTEPDDYGPVAEYGVPPESE
jgi:hypothetical protein